jgi:hypothetical protein
MKRYHWHETPLLPRLLAVQMRENIIVIYLTGRNATTAWLLDKKNVSTLRTSCQAQKYELD